ncbi:MAG: guanylate kinase [Nitrospirota bacterium]|nr:guanylate kinase [Nitrospirota bacterium]MDP2381411.1 guanylate kinase [Nitrospirota bacterium]MDP3596751.1 guanylate kinase [Nitrospirota bacterium]
MSISTTTSSPAPVSGQPRSSTDRRGILFIISAPSGTGKTTLCKQLTTNLPDLWHSISYTTRQPRLGEEHGREYYFIDEQPFQEMIDRNEFVEWARVYGNLYGTPWKSLTEKIDQGIDVLLEIDVQGAMQVRKRFEDSVSIFILPPSMAVLRSRLQTRASDSAEEIQRRLHKVKEEVWSFREYAYIVRNDDIDRSIRDLESIFWSERLKTKRLNMTWLENNFILDDEQKS